MNGGYLMVSKSDTNLYTKLNNALTLGKPILWYEDVNTCYYIDTITKSGTDIVLTKGGKSITIESDGTITEIGDVLTIMENIVDANGNKRFVEGEGISSIIEGVTFIYNKWSLSGSHLMFLLSGEVDNGTVIPANQIYATYELPKWIYDKIIPYVNDRVEIKNTTYYDNLYGTQVATSLLVKNTSPETIGIFTTAITLSNDRTFRIQFDLLINAE